jgi:hypothetical protein
VVLDLKEYTFQGDPHKEDKELEFDYKVYYISYTYGQISFIFPEISCFDNEIILTGIYFHDIISYEFWNWYMHVLNERIKKLRLMLEISQRQFAKQIFVSQGLLAEIESNTPGKAGGLNS